MKKNSLNTKINFFLKTIFPWIFCLVIILIPLLLIIGNIFQISVFSFSQWLIEKQINLTISGTLFLGGISLSGILITNFFNREHIEKQFKENKENLIIQLKYKEKSTAIFKLNTEMDKIKNFDEIFITNDRKNDSNIGKKLEYLKELSFNGKIITQFIDKFDRLKFYNSFKKIKRDPMIFNYLHPEIRETLEKYLEEYKKLESYTISFFDENIKLNNNAIIKEFYGDQDSKNSSFRTFLKYSGLKTFTLQNYNTKIQGIHMNFNLENFLEKNKEIFICKNDESLINNNFLGIQKYYDNKGLENDLYLSRGNFVICDYELEPYSIKLDIGLYYKHEIIEKFDKMIVSILEKSILEYKKFGY